MKTNAYHITTRRDWVATIGRLGLWLAIIGLGALIWLPTYWYLWLTLVFGGLGWLVRWHAHHFAYRCSHCDHIFMISPWVDLVSPQGLTGQGGGWKYLRCPQCHGWSRATTLSMASVSSRKGSL